MSRSFLTTLVTLGLALVASLAGAVPLAAQVVRTPESRLAGRLDEATRQQVLAQLDSAESAGLPADPLLGRALEGAAKRAAGRPVTGAQIVDEVRDLRLRLGSARQALGARASSAELAAGAAALQVRVHPTVLAALRRARPEGALTVPLSVLTDLVSLGVPSDTAARTVIALARVQDATLVAFQRDVERDIGVGALPGAAAAVRAGGLERAAADAFTGAPASPVPPGVENGSQVPPRPPVRRKP